MKGQYTEPVEYWKSIQGKGPPQSAECGTLIAKLKRLSLYAGSAERMFDLEQCTGLTV